MYDQVYDICDHMFNQSDHAHVQQCLVSSSFSRTEKWSLLKLVHSINRMALPRYQKSEYLRMTGVVSNPQWSAVWNLYKAYGNQRDFVLVPDSSSVAKNFKDIYAEVRRDMLNEFIFHWHPMLSTLKSVPKLQFCRLVQEVLHQVLVTVIGCLQGSSRQIWKTTPFFCLWKTPRAMVSDPGNLDSQWCNLRSVATGCYADCSSTFYMFFSFTKGLSPLKASRWAHSSSTSPPVMTFSGNFRNETPKPLRTRPKGLNGRRVFHSSPFHRLCLVPENQPRPGTG